MMDIQTDEGHFYSPPPLMSGDKNLNPSYKTDLDLEDCLGKVKTLLQQNFTLI